MILGSFLAALLVIGIAKVSNPPPISALSDSKTDRAHRKHLKEVFASVDNEPSYSAAKLCRNYPVTKLKQQLHLLISSPGPEKSSQLNPFLNSLR